MKRTDTIGKLEDRIRAAELRRDGCGKCHGAGTLYKIERVYVPAGRPTWLLGIPACDSIEDVSVAVKCECQKEVDRRKLDLADYLEGVSK